MKKKSLSMNQIMILSLTAIVVGILGCAIAFFLRTYHYNGGIYKNAWWVGAANCPGDAKENDASNPWRYVRAATATEISQ